MAAAIITATVLVQAKRAPRRPDYEEELRRRTDAARMAGFTARQCIKRDAKFPHHH